MEKTLTKSEVEWVVLKHIFKVGDWVVGWHCDHEYREKAWQIGEFRGNTLFVVPKERPDWDTGIRGLRHATPEEIAAAEWEEGKEYRVWDSNGVKRVRVSSNKVGKFYTHGCYEGNTNHYDKYEKL